MLRLNSILDINAYAHDGNTRKKKIIHSKKNNVRNWYKYLSIGICIVIRLIEKQSNVYYCVSVIYYQ